MIKLSDMLAITVRISPIALLFLTARAHASGSYFRFSPFELVTFFAIIGIVIILVYTPVIFALVLLLRFSTGMKRKLLGSLSCAAFAVVLGIALMYAMKLLGYYEDPITRRAVLIIMIAFPLLARSVFREEWTKVLALDILAVAPLLVNPMKTIDYIIRTIFF